jgi:hypothetical protein
MFRGESGSIASDLFQEHVVKKGYQAPATSAELQSIILASGATVVLSGTAPPDFTGVQIGGTLYVNGTSSISDHKRKQILAHEWFHYLRRGANDDALQTYLYSDRPHARDVEEHRAKEFERLF